MEPAPTIGHYALRHRIGSGAMGEVWAADLVGPHGFRKPVALKRLKPGTIGDHARDALLQEAKLGALLHHPNVVSVSALEEHDGAWVMAMELVRGTSVAGLLDRGALPAQALLDLGVQAARGLHHIHTLAVDGRPAHLVHRDIKPSNLLVDQAGVVKIADLGIAAAAADGTVVGTPAYMAPEQWHGRAEARTDLFALGVVLFVCATHKLPFGRGRVELTERIVAERLAADGVLELAETAVSGLAAVLRRCLQPSPADRFASAAELGEALAALRPFQADGPGLLALLSRARPDLTIDEDFGTRPASRTDGDTTGVQLLGQLPATHDRFFGRESEVAALTEALSGDERLVTLLGFGGMGKTRLSIEAASGLRRDLYGGAWFVDLSDAFDADGICTATARALRLELRGDDPVGQIAHAMRARGRALFVLDNLEQCVDTIVPMLQRWLEVSEHGRFLCTSRVLLGLAGERVTHLDPLPEDDAVAMFVDRAPATVEPEHLADVRAIVQGVQGLPLAIELAAARTALMPVAMVRSRLGPQLLATRRRDVPERHRSLEGCLAWSWDLLSEPARLAMSQLSVCEGGFNLAAAEAIVRLPPDAGWALPVLTELCDASLLRVNAAAGRFFALTVVHGWAAGRPFDRAEAEARHCAWFTQVAADPQAADLDNIVVACRRALTAGRPDEAGPLARGAWRLLARTGPFHLGLDLLLAARAATTGEEHDKLTDRLIAALSMTGRSTEALELSQAELARRGEPAGFEVLSHLGDICRQLGRRDEARGWLERALADARRRGDRVDEGHTLANLGHLASGDSALQLYEQGLQRLRQAGWLREETRVRLSMAGAHLAMGRNEEALAMYQAVLRRCRADGMRRLEAITLAQIATVHLFMSRMDEAERFFHEALALYRDIGDRAFEARSLLNLVSVAYEQGRFDDALALLNQALAIYVEGGNDAGISSVLNNRGVVLAAAERHDEARAAYERALALARRPNDEVLPAGNLGAAAEREGRLQTALMWCQRAVDAVEPGGDCERYHGHMLTAVARLTGRLGDPEAGLEILARAEAELDRFGEVQFLAMAKLTRAELVGISGDLTRAYALLEEVEGSDTAAKRLSVRTLADRIRSRIGEREDT